jgi:hypothetical protein
MVGVAAALSGCSRSEGVARPSREFCEAAAAYDDKAYETRDDAAAQAQLLEPMAANAPEDIKADMDLFLAAMQKKAEGDSTVVDNPNLAASVERVNRRAQQGCDLLQPNEESPGI